MIRTSSTSDGIGLTGDLSPDTFAYVDAEWVLAQPSMRVQAILVDRGRGTARFGDGPPIQLKGDDDPNISAASLLLELCEAAVAAVGTTPADATEVWGRGAIALQAGGLLGITAVAPDAEVSRPSAIIETTGDPASIAEATRRLADLGTLVMVGEPLDRVLSLDLYADVHSRGLHIVGVPRPTRVPLAASSQERLDHLIATLEDGCLDAPLKEGAAWYRVA